MKKEKMKKELLNKKVCKIIDQLENILHESERNFLYTEDLRAAIDRLSDWTLIKEDGKDYYFST